MAQESRTPARSPNWRTASARAASGVSPAAIRRSVRVSMWKRSSSSMSRSTRRRPKGMRKTRRISALREPRLRRDQRLADGADVAIPRRHLGLQLRPAAATQLIVLRAAVVLRVAPFGGEPALLLEAMERRVERSFLDEELAVGDH